MLVLTRSRLGLMAGLFFVAAAVLACDEDDDVVGAQPPAGFEVAVSTSTDTVTVSWEAQTDVDSMVVTIASNPVLSVTVAGDATEAIFTSDDGLEDGVTVTASVTAYGQGGSTDSGNTPTVETDFFPWDEYYPESLHYTRAGKSTFYNESPNGGFESLTGVAYSALPCQGCHRYDQVPGARGCESCHTTEPKLGAEVDATLDGVCGDCHSRQKAEANHFTDYHRDELGMTCMDCHSLEDVHGDGNSYSSMLEDGAIDASCDNCHTSVVSNSYHNIHGDLLDCSTCHTQGIVSCYNCHLEGQLASPPIKKARAQLTSWMFLVNDQSGKVHPANVQTLEYQGQTWVAMAPFYGHTIDRNAVSGCGDCHGNAAIDAFNADSTLVVTEFDGVNNVIPWQGIIPVPENFQDVFSFDFLHYDPGTDTWSFVETGPDGWQLLYGTPLTDAQLSDLN